MASLTGQLVAETYKALLKTIDNDILTASEKQITDGLGGGSNVFIDSQGFLRANKYKVTNGLATQFLKADGSLDANTYLTGITSSQIITALGYTPVTNARTLTINGTTYDLSANRSWTVAGTAAVWGNITGTLSNQTDLQTALNAKFNNPTGTISQYIRGDGSLATFPTLPGGLPTGGTAGQILAKIDATDYNTHWIDNFATQTKNEVKLGATLAKGTAVYVSGSTGGSGTNMIVMAASNASEALSSKTFGLLETGGVTNDLVKCVTFGLLAGLDTSTAQAGDPVWLGVNGALLFGLANKPVAPANMVYIGVVTRVQSNNGEIFVNVQNGFEIEELHDVLITSKANNQGLFYESSTGLWKNKSIATVLGYTPQAQLDGTGFVKASGTTISYDNSTYLTTSDAASTYQRLDRMAINLLASDIQYPNNNAVIAALALKANAANPVFTGNMTISGAEPKLFFTDTDNNPDYTVFIDSGVFYIYDQTAGATRFSISSTGNISSGVGKSITAGSFVKESGTAAQFLKADGSIDSSTYVTSTALADYLLITTAASTYQRLDRIASSLFASATNYPNNNAVIAGLALKADAANPVFTGSMNIQGLESRINFYDENNLRKFFIGYSSGQLSIYQDAGSATRFQINSSGNITTGVNNTITSWGFIKDGGTSSQYLMADGSVSTGVVTGTGTTNYIPKWTSASAIGNSLIFDNGTNVGINTASPSSILHVNGGAVMTAGWNRSTTLQAQYPVLTFNSNATKWAGIGYDHGNAMIFWVNATNNDVSGTGNAALQIANSGNAQFGNDLTVANQTYLGFVGNVLFTKSNGTSYSRFLNSGAHANILYVGGTDANNGVLGINNYEDSVRLFNMTNGGTAIFAGNVLVNGATTLTGIQGGVAVNGTTSSGVVYRLSNANRGYTYISGNGNMNVETTSGNISLAPNGSPTLTVDSLGRVGIGVVSSGDKLVVFSGASRNVQRFSSSSNGMYNTYASAVGDVGYIGNGPGILSGAIESDFGVRSEGALVLASGGNNQRIKVFSNGNVFIGSSASDAGFRLDVNGTGRFSGNVAINGSANSLDINPTTGQPNITLRTGNTFRGYIEGNSSGGMSFGTGASAAICLTLASGGAATFSSSVTAYGNAATNSAINSYNTLGSGGTAQYYQDFGNGAGFVAGRILRGNGASGLEANGLNIDNHTGFKIRLNQLGGSGGTFSVDGGAATFSSSVTANNNINVNASANTIAPQFVMSQTGGNTYSAIGINRADGTGISTGLGSSLVFRSGDASDFPIQFATANNIRMTISTSGFLGIGTQSPLAPIHASGGTAMTGGWVRTAMLSAVYPVLAFNSNNSKWAGIGYDFSGSQAFIIWVNAGSENVSTGTGALVIAGSGAATFVSSVTATSFFESSDLRKKKLIESNPIIAGIENLQAKLYEKNGKLELGYFAQDAEKIMPYAVTKNADGFLNLSYREVHTAKIARLEKEVAELKEKLNLN